jgi:hypothetical protein
MNMHLIYLHHDQNVHGIEFNSTVMSRDAVFDEPMSWS